MNVAELMCTILNCTLALLMLLVGVWAVNKIVKIIFGEKEK